MRDNHAIQKKNGIESSIIVDLISEIKEDDIHESLLRDIAGMHPKELTSLFFNAGGNPRNIVSCIKAFLAYKPQKALRLVDAADIRVWHNSGFLKSSYLIHTHDIFYFNNYTAPYLRDSFNGINEMKLRLELLAHNDLDLHYITPSRFNKETLDKLGVNYSSVDILPLYHKYTLEYQLHDASVPKLLGYGRYSRNKGIPELANLCHESNIEFTYFGDKDSLSEHAIQYRYAKAYESWKIRLYGKVKDINPFFTASNIYVCNSAFEGFNFGAVESMAHSLPVLLRSGTAMDEFFEKASESGLEIGYSFDNVNEIPALADKIISNYAKLSQDAWKFSQNYTYDKYANHYIYLLRKYCKAR